MRVFNYKAVQVHPVPTQLTAPKGPFPREMFAEPEIIYDYAPADDVDGSNLPLGATAQNNYKPVQVLRCGDCLARVLETETELHMCEE